MATITINGQQFEVEDGRPLVEVIKESGFYISNLCYIDGLAPYAGCRSCAVEVEGMRGLPLSCTTLVQDGMVVRTDSPAVLEMRQEVMAMILANHSDRCLTCHRVEHCRTGEICLRDNAVTHRCVTCSKNYRCELQTASDVADIGRANIEPYLDEQRTFYQWEHPAPDRENPYLEFDPQMCILCTRCVRACDDLRHTNAITLAGRGFSTRIAFGLGGKIHDSNCDFCGSCIDVCPTATLMEAPNKWVARPEQWVTTACNECSVGCTLQMGVRNGKPVIVRPAEVNEISRKQICVRGRFGYDVVREKHRLKRARLGRGDAATDPDADAVLADAAMTLQAIIDQHGAEAVGVLGSPTITNEENYTVRRLAEMIGTPHVDSSAGYIDGPVAEALTAAFGSAHLPNRFPTVETADRIVVIADDLESSHNVAALRIKDAVTRQGATLISIAPRAGEVDDFATATLRASGPAAVATLTEELASALLADGDRALAIAELDGSAAITAQTPSPAVAEAAGALAGGERVAVVLAPSRQSAAIAAAQTRAAAALAIALAGPEAAPAALHVFPAESNAVGLRDMGVHPAEDGLNVAGMLAAARAGQLKALIIAGDNPLLTLPNRSAVQAALDALDLCLVIDEVATDTVAAATHVLPDVSPYAKDGTITSADRQILRRRAAVQPLGASRPAGAWLLELGRRLEALLGREGHFPFATSAEITDAIRADVPGYAEATSVALVGAVRQPANGATAQALPLAEAPTAYTATGDGGMTLLTARDLFTDRAAAAIRLPDADRLHRAEQAEIHPRDAASLGIGDGGAITLEANGARLEMTAHVTENVPEGAVFVPWLWNGAAVLALLDDDGVATVRVSSTSGVATA